MTGQVQESPVPPQCPRCRGIMYKPIGSPFYWHATNDHPRCNITNIVEIPKAVPIDQESTSGKKLGNR